MGKNTLIFTHGGGRLANQMTNHAHLIAFQEEYKDSFNVVNIAFAPYSSLFQKMIGAKVQYVPQGNKNFKWFNDLLGNYVTTRESNKISISNQLLRLYHLVFSILPYSQSIKVGDLPAYLAFLPGKNLHHFNLNDKEFVALLRRKPITVLSGWPVRCWDLFYKYSNIIRSSFELRKDVVEKSEQFINGLRNRFDIIIGVMIRQGDYKEWMDGKYYFESGEYASCMSQAIELFPDKNVGFVIASDQMKKMEDFFLLPVVLSTGLTSGKGHFIESFSDLSLCDYIMTPPSTFGIWAAFLNNKPIIPIYKKNQTIKDSDILKNHLFDSLTHLDMSLSLK